MRPRTLGKIVIVVLLFAGGKAFMKGLGIG